ncbi:RcnB family protein [Caulobacter segnis]|uniref:RcnB family protein n=1 Tax=Caulobacter segnis TaxID=88688 RepID=UPI00285A1495|nr:RcnB family protein [Caulobacter segnis]MDR6627184.1 Ni/Co efflux regulator RcnB [Caulobacter segnis]
MKRVITTALALSLLAGAAQAGAAEAVVAQEQQQQREPRPRDEGQRPDRGGERWGERGGDRGGPRQPDSGWNRPSGDSGWNRSQAQPARPDGDRDRGRDDRRGGWDRHDNNRPGGPDRDRGRDDNRWNDRRDRDRNDYRWNDNRNWDWNDRGRDRYRDRDRGRPHYDRYSYRPSYRAPQRYRAPVYAYPRGWYARPWAFGDRLPGGWYGSSYYLDAWRYGLPQPPIGCEWVRVGDDAILVDVWSGQVLSVWRDLFW